MPDISNLLAPESDEEDVQDIVLDSDVEEASGSSSSSSESESEDDQRFPDLDSDEDDDETIMRDIAPKKISGSSFSAMGLSKLILTNIQRKGFKTPTPIQRKAIPPIVEGQDVVGMARTGSGKTAAFVLPMIQKLKVHSAKVGARALILSPSRELAIQTLRVVKDFSKKSDLRSVLLVGGDSLEDQFGFMMNNPDIIIATPGRFWHLQVEMRLDLSTVEYVVFDEADRLFEMGFAEQLNEILASLPELRQTLLFSATLPPSLVDFAKAGLKNPQLVRLDADQKVSDQLQMGFFATKDSERDAALLYILQDLIKMPLMSEEQREYLKKREDVVYDEEGKLERRERLPHALELPTPQSTIVFVPTKHHVEYISQLLKLNGYAVSAIYGSLDQAARREQLYLFRAGKTSILVVTDVAARGVDIPMLANVINFNMTTSARVFVHRVGRTARAGHQGWAYTLVRQSDLPYLADLEVFLGRKIVNAKGDYSQSLVLGGLPRSGVEFHMEQNLHLLKREYDLSELSKVALRGEKLYNKTREAASKEGVRRARELANTTWDRPHPLAVHDDEAAKEDLLAQFANRKTKETVFEFKKNGAGDSAQLMARRRVQIAPVQERLAKRKRVAQAEADASNKAAEEAASSKAASAGRFADKTFFMSHYEPLESLQERGYSLHGTAGFSDAVRDVSFGVNDEGKDFQTKQITRWDKKRGKYINTTGENKVKYIKGESGHKIPASLRTGKFEDWKRAHKVSGITDGPNTEFNKFQHRKLKAPKPADKARDDYAKRKGKVAKAVESGLRVKGHPTSVSLGIQSNQTIQKQRAQKQKRWEKSNQPAKRRK
ncbi:ATP-dependent RNA helicase DBP10 [Wickerhamiella sorbophila]|uniref:ATP-dependent RNA helicase DBP10 n=1 Tax=Wickerhamiella sorbophila TaxID=45607 RepID=A0A2T0FLM8_9ASCO|nr:ATP-dependent RNA helicase DBP10 [Wickerhamiella sorbophila]PRT55880.1 ATP-dependent RNA helicase DBP10 [Wickerhamiella sorbophila]